MPYSGYLTTVVKSLSIFIKTAVQLLYIIMKSRNKNSQITDRKMRARKKHSLDISDLCPIVIQHRLKQIERCKSSVDYHKYPNSSFIQSNSRGSLLINSDESEYDFYRRIREQVESCAQSRMSSTQASHPDNLRTRQATRNSFARSPLRYNQANDLSKQLKRAAESRNAKSRNASPDRKPKPGSPRKRTQTQPPVTSNSNDRKQSEGKKDGVGIVAEGEDNKSEEKLTQQEPEEAENTQLEEDELYSLKKEVKTPAFVKRHPDKFCIDDMGRGTRQQFVLIATAYNTDHTRKQIVDKYRRLMDNSTPMKKLMHKDQNEDLEKYKRWLDGEQRYVGFGSQLDLRKNQYVAEKTNREKEKTDTTAGTEN